MSTDAAVFLPREDRICGKPMQTVVRALERSRPLLLRLVAKGAAQWHRTGTGPVTARSAPFMGYDFQLANTGPRLIEINSHYAGSYRLFAELF